MATKRKFDSFVEDQQCSQDRYDQQQQGSGMMPARQAFDDDCCGVCPPCSCCKPVPDCCPPCCPVPQCCPCPPPRPCCICPPCNPTPPDCPGTCPTPVACPCKGCVHPDPPPPCPTPTPPVCPIPPCGCIPYIKPRPCCCMPPCCIPEPCAPPRPPALCAKACDDVSDVNDEPQAVEQFDAVPGTESKVLAKKSEVLGETGCQQCLQVSCPPCLSPPPCRIPSCCMQPACCDADFEYGFSIPANSVADFQKAKEQHEANQENNRSRLDDATNRSSRRSRRPSKSQ